MVDDKTMRLGTEAAYAQALKSFNEGGVPVGSALTIAGRVIAVGHNQRVQTGSNVLHGETDCIENAGHEHDLSKAVLFTTLSPCPMCTGAILLFSIPTAVVLDNENIEDFDTSIDYLRAKGVDVLIEPHAPSIELNRTFQRSPATRRIWLGDVGERE
ncbi:MAG: nucleoside deaminase [Pseudomonadota bacterium]